MLGAEETGKVPKGTATVGVGRQDTGTAGRIEVAQVAVYLVYAGPCGHAFIDRERSLPAADDPHRLHRAGVPAQVTFATTPALARRMVTRALAAGVQARWFAGDEVDGHHPHLRRALRARGLGDVLTIARSHQLGTTLGFCRAVELAVRPQLTWHRQAAGAHGHRCYAWALVGLHRTDSDDDRHGGHHALHWSHWRRRTQARARSSHYQRQTLTE